MREVNKQGFQSLTKGYMWCESVPLQHLTDVWRRSSVAHNVDWTQLKETKAACPLSSACIQAKQKAFVPSVPCWYSTCTVRSPETDTNAPERRKSRVSQLQITTGAEKAGESKSIHPFLTFKPVTRSLRQV